MKKFLFIAFFIVVFLSFSERATAQVPSSCFEVESILADACGNPEGQNEMIRLKVGPNQLDANNLNIDWPNLTWKGLIQNQQTADSVQYINSTIQGCGYLIEPSGYILPAGADVLVFTSYNFIASAHSFANLNDTLYVLFQNSTTTTGHYKNICTSPCGSRTTVVSFSSPAGCANDTAIYYPDSLTTFNGSDDGARIDFAWDGSTTYANDGCQPPVTAFTVSASSNDTTACTGDTIALSGSVTGKVDTVFWWGGSGTYTNPDSLITDYVVGSNDSGITNIYFSSIDICNDTITDTVSVDVTQSPVASIALSGNDTICQGNSVTLTAQGGGSYSWNTGVSSQSIIVNSGGTYAVEVSNSCGIDSAYQNIVVMPQPNAGINASSTSLCPSDTVTLYGTGGDSYNWSGGQSGDSILVTNSGSYYVVANNFCGSDTSSIISISTDSIPNASIAVSGDTVICEGESTTLNGNGNGNYLWSTTETTSSVVVNQTANYWLEVSNNCGVDTAFQFIEVIPIEAAFTVSPSEGTIPLTVSFSNNSQNANGYTWDFGDGNTDTTTSPEHNYDEDGNYTVILTATNQAGCTDTAVYEFISVTRETFFEIPNVFSPNQDGVNDLFTVKSSGVEGISGKIFNRWGQLLFEWNKVTMSWDGRTYEGGLAPAGEYYYLIEITINGKTETHKGYLTLLR